MMRRSLLLALLRLGAVYAEYIWPNEEIDLLEHMLYEHSGYHVNSPASFVVPCGNVPFGLGRNGPAEWVRTAYHDMANADVEAGTGGVDASIGFELDRDENPGKGFNETLFNLREFMTSRTSMADLIAMGALFAVGGCSGGQVQIPFRGGRIDATGAGPLGVPKPEEPLDDHVASFKRQGFTRDEMIGLVACGHTLGGIHGVDFPEIVDVVNDTVGLPERETKPMLTFRLWMIIPKCLTIPPRVKHHSTIRCKYILSSKINTLTYTDILGPRPLLQMSRKTLLHSDTMKLPAPMHASSIQTGVS